jgi:hypothetical protein
MRPFLLFWARLMVQANFGQEDSGRGATLPVPSDVCPGLDDDMAT